jgi:hypothetical protein
MAKKTTAETDDRTVTKDELKQVDRANSSGKQPVVFVHGLWLLPSSWGPWAKVFEAAGYSAVRPGWPDDPDTVAEAKAHPEVFARKSVGQIAGQIALREVRGARLGRADLPSHRRQPQPLDRSEG